MDLNSRNNTVNSSPPEQNGCHCADDIFNCIFLNENDRIPIQISLKYVPRSPIDNGLAPNRLIDAYAALGGDELM